jgi:protein-S-isoprenylcysteine O-methyltransferase Ste14
MQSQRGDDSPAVRFPPPAIYLIFLMLGLALQAWFPIHLLPSNLAAWVVGGVILAAGLALGPIWGLRTMRKAVTTVRPDTAVAKLVTDGPFRFSRNPLYVALTLMAAGIAIIANSPWGLLSVVPALLVMRFFVIPREESYLARAFGDEYAQYKARVRRWL